MRLSVNLEGRYIGYQSILIFSLFIKYTENFSISGDVRGSIKSATDGSQYAQFLGIPYAEPPLGYLRFARPKPYSQSWNKSIRDARKKPPKCLQIHPESEDVIGTEDCLVLNIYVPCKYYFLNNN